MEQGLGKTLTYAAEFLEQVATERVTRSVVICPNSFKSGWVTEIEKWGLGIDTHIVEAGKADYWTKRFLATPHDKPPMLIVNYEAIRQERIQQIILDFVYDRSASICADESIQISTHNADQTKAAIKLAKEFEFRRILSGKWMKKGPHDFWSQLRFLGLIDGFNYFSWRNRFCKMGGFKGKQVVGAQNEDKLAEIIEPHIFRALKSEWTDLPPKTYTKRTYSLGALQAPFDDMMEEFITYLESSAVTVDTAITKYIKLAQIQCGFIIDEEGKTHQLISDDRNPRLNALRSFLDDEVQGKVAIPFHHRYSYGMLQRALASYQPAYITGGMQPDEIEAQKRRFNEDDQCRVILLQTRASKYGHTLLGEQDLDINACSTMAFFENTYSLDDRSQIEDRIHRHGQRQSNVNYVDFVGTEIDERMINALAAREDMYQGIMGFLRARTSASQDTRQFAQ